MIIVPKLVKEFPEFYGNGRIITVFTKAVFTTVTTYPDP
jgi:hypothetical protein